MSIKIPESIENIPNYRFILIGIVHIGVGIGIVSLSSFLNSELKFLGWSSSQISIYLGVPIIFELSRMYFGNLYDNTKLLKRPMILGISTGFFGIFLSPNFIVPVGNVWIVFIVSFFYFGSAILTTLVDSNLTELSNTEQRSTVAGILQTLRLLGFAIGGFVGSVLFSQLKFDTFMQLIALSFLILSLISLFSVIPARNTTKHIENQISSSINLLPHLIKQKLPFLMTLFLLIYPIGLFMQDLILEPFAIDLLNFGKENVGLVVAIWTSLTLVFVPIGVFLSKKIGKSKTIIIGQIFSFLGLVGFSLTPVLLDLYTFYLSLVIFGIGNGIASAPSISLMLEVCAIYKENLSLLLGFFGILITLGRFVSSLLGGLILFFTTGNYQILFVIESIFALLAIFPITQLEKLIDMDIDTTSISDEHFVHPDL